MTAEGSPDDSATTESDTTKSGTTERVPPVAPRREHRREAHGTAVDDPWYWLRDRDDPEVIAYLAAENAYTEAVSAPDAQLREALFEEIRSRVQETDLSVPVRKGPWLYYVRTVEGRQYPIHCRRPADVSESDGEGPEEILLDENVEAGDSEYFAVGDLVVSPDHELLAYSTDHDGDERYHLRFRRIVDGTEIPDEIPDINYGVAWGNDSRTVFYTLTDEAQRPDRVVRHSMGASVDDDTVVFSEPDERFYVGVGATRSDRFVVIASEAKTTTEVLVIDADEPLSEPSVIEPRRDGIEYRLEHQGDRFLITTNDDALDFRLMETPVAAPGRDNWKEIRPEPPDGRLDGVDAFAGHFVVTERRGGLPLLTVIDVAEGSERVLAFDEEVYEAGLGPNAEYDTSVFRFGYGSMVTPGSVFEEDFSSGERVLLKRQPVLGGFDRKAYDTRRLWAGATDGTEVPLSLVWRKDMVEPGRRSPLLLYGYGSYETVMPATFSAARLSLLDRGVTFAIAHVRGGGELGRRWYEDGRLLHKANTFTDFIACADHLVETGWCTPDRLAARGGSAGGLLMGAVANLRPELFAAIVAEVPFVDNVNTMLDPTIPLTVTEYDEWGDPADPEYYEAMTAYSPYENISAEDYPAMLVTAGLNDPRVQYWEPAKYVAKLRATATGDRPLLLRTEMGAGHGGPSGRYDAWHDEAFVLAFLIRALGLE